jgi:hypothetical protein
MMHPHTELRFISPEKGYGVVATRFIPKGTITWVQDKLDRRFSPASVQKMGPAYQSIIDTYAFRNNRGEYVLCWDIARFVNHSFASNCLTTAYDFEIAIRDIEAGEELTDDYGYLNVEEPFEPNPEPGSTRTKVLPDDLLHFYDHWDKLLIGAFPELSRVEQPLSLFINPRKMSQIMAISKGEKKMASILSCYFDSGANGSMEEA